MKLVEGKTGFVCKPCDIRDLAETLEKYFGSELFRGLASFRLEFREYAFAEHSWEAVAARNAQSIRSSAANVALRGRSLRAQRSLAR